ncbi:helix-turn-helix protein [Nocardioides sp. J9]|uniref:MmyB family transcriptional regulator n=1 Tax=Nocardioides sp. J9 TaxID=935844 RepID=UPI0011A0F11D|nr:helix-turn-helix domain-containing protein [Nocardioides sp. J9]TWG99021.1 helix-turn-helix protein [Nocardioides sp. J9]
MPRTRYDELGRFLRSRRDRVRPADVGLTPGPRRRVPGLRRDEVAMLAGASVEYYTELERGAGSQPSEGMLAALARALRLSNDERDHLFHLANRALPVEGGSASHLHPAMLDLLSRMASTPAMVITDLHVVLVQNPLAVALLGDLSVHQGRSASFLYRWFTDEDTRGIYPEEDHAPQSRSFVADLRAAVGRRDAGDTEASELVASLLEDSPEFSALWHEHDVAVRRHERKRIQHPTVGLIDLDVMHLVSEDGRQRLLWFTPRPGTDASDRLALLTVIGTQAMEAATSK